MQQFSNPSAQAGQPINFRLNVNGAKKWQNRPVSHLLLMQSQENYTWLFWQNGERILLPRTLKYVEDKLPTGQFVRLRRDCAVNINYIERVEYVRFDQMRVWLRTGECINVARRRVLPLRLELKNHPTLSQYVA